jgi:hypothetical protein
VAASSEAWGWSTNESLKMFGRNISEVEFSHINAHGLWLCIKDKGVLSALQ